MRDLTKICTIVFLKFLLHAHFAVIEKGGGLLGFQISDNEEGTSYDRIKVLVNDELKKYFRLNSLELIPLVIFSHV